MLPRENWIFLKHLNPEVITTVIEKTGLTTLTQTQEPRPKAGSCQSRLLPLASSECPHPTWSMSQGQGLSALGPLPSDISKAHRVESWAGLGFGAVSVHCLV